MTAMFKGTLARNFTVYVFGPITKIGLFKDLRNIFHPKNMNEYE